MQASGPEMDRYDNFGAFEDEDYRNAGESSAPTEESGPEEEEKKSFDSKFTALEQWKAEREQLEVFWKFSSSDSCSF